MSSTEKECGYLKCCKKFYGTKRAVYCCDKHGQYQRRLNKKEIANEQDNKRN